MGPGVALFTKRNTYFMAGWVTYLPSPGFPPLLRLSPIVYHTSNPTATLWARKNQFQHWHKPPLRSAAIYGILWESEGQPHEAQANHHQQHQRQPG
jgi:hypothetical protein